MHKKLMAAAVGSAVAAATLGKTELRELTVTVTIKARVADDSPRSHRWWSMPCAN